MIKKPIKELFAQLFSSIYSAANKHCNDPTSSMLDAQGKVDPVRGTSFKIMENLSTTLSHSKWISGLLSLYSSLYVS